jgi:aminoglycoside phosphotransferase (APT) family kinase protein
MRWDCWQTGGTRGLKMAEDRNTLQLISDITEFNDLHEYMQDEHLDKALAIVVKLLMNPDVPTAKAPMLIMELQAMSTKFAVMSSVYSTIAKDKAGTPNNNKKNVYYSVKESIDKLVDALKYVVRYNS